MFLAVFLCRKWQINHEWTDFPQLQVWLRFSEMSELLVHEQDFLGMDSADQDVWVEILHDMTTSWKMQR